MGTRGFENAVLEDYLLTPRGASMKILKPENWELGTGNWQLPTANCPGYLPTPIDGYRILLLYLVIPAGRIDGGLYVILDSRSTGLVLLAAAASLSFAGSNHVCSLCSL